MDAEFTKAHHALESRHWLFAARREVIYKLIRQEADPGSSPQILDIGCSSGHLIHFLNSRGFTGVWGVDIEKTAIENCRKSGLKDVKVGSALKTGFPDSHFDFVVASHILEHIDDDVAALREWGRVLKPGGKLMLFVPAHMLFWGEMDELVHHKRRYSKKGLRTAVQAAGLREVRATYWNFTLFFAYLPLILLRRLFRSKRHSLRETNRLANWLLLWLLRIENAWLSHFNLPAGINLLLLAERPSQSGLSEK